MNCDKKETCNRGGNCFMCPFNNEKNGKIRISINKKDPVIYDAMISAYGRDMLAFTIHEDALSSLVNDFNWERLEYGEELSFRLAFNGEE